MIRVLVFSTRLGNIRPIVFVVFASPHMTDHVTCTGSLFFNVHLQTASVIEDSTMTSESSYCCLIIVVVYFNSR